MNPVQNRRSRAGQRLRALTAAHPTAPSHMGIRSRRSSVGCHYSSRAMFPVARYGKATAVVTVRARHLARPALDTRAAPAPGRRVRSRLPDSPAAHGEVVSRRDQAEGSMPALRADDGTLYTLTALPRTVRSANGCRSWPSGEVRRASRDPAVTRLTPLTRKRSPGCFGIHDIEAGRACADGAEWSSL